MKQAIEYCINNHILEDYLRRKGSDVMGFLCAEYDYEMDMKVKGEEALEEGLEQGLKQGEARLISLQKCLMEDGKSNMLEKVITDKEYREEMYKKYKIK